MFESTPIRFSFTVTPIELERLLELSKREQAIDDIPVRSGNLVIDITRTDIVDVKKATPQRLIANPQWEDVTDSDSI